MITTVIILGIALAAALVVLWVASHRVAQLKAEQTRLEQERQALAAEAVTSQNRFEQERQSLAAQITLAETRLTDYKEQVAQREEQRKAESEKAEQTMREQFKNLSNEIISEQSKRFKETNRESIDILLKPFKDNIVEFRKRVEEIHTTESEKRGELKNELQRLMELNQRITTETTNLTNALKGNSKVQGDWGEMLLETILDDSGLTKGQHYELQQTLKDEQGNNVRPDAILYLPDDKRIVIDSKVSLTAFVSYVNAETETERHQALSAHIASVRKHIGELGDKNYQRLFNSPDFVIMFVPNEPAFLEALKADSAMWADAYNRKVVISSPTNLFAILKIISDLWQRAAQNKNTEQIVACGTKLCEKLANFVESLDDVGKALDKAKSSYDESYSRLCSGKGNIIRTGEELHKLGLKPKKRLSKKALDAANIEAEEISEEGAEETTDDTPDQPITLPDTQGNE